METNKPRVLQDYYKLTQELQEQVKLQYPYGFVDNLIQFTNAKGQNVTAIRFETEDKIYLLRMSVQSAFQIMEDDDDYDEDHNLKYMVKKEYEDKYGEAEYRAENEDLATY